MILIGVRPDARAVGLSVKERYMAYKSQKLLAAISGLLCVTFVCTNARAACTVPSFAAAANFAVGSQPLSVGIGDFNSDGKRDLAVANFTSNNISILLGNGTGGFGAAATFLAATNPSAVAVTDLNSDSKLDLVVTNAGSDNVSVLLGNGAGGFGTPKNFFVGANPSAVAFGDFNGDGRTDLAVANADTNNVSVLSGDGLGGFAAPANFPVGYTPLALALGDFNGDGIRDIAVANFFYDDNGDNISVLLGNGAGSFTRAPELYAGTNPTAIAAADFNGDGKLDLAVVNTASYDVSIFLGNGAGGFMDQTVFDVAVSPTSIATGDFNSDGRIDLAVANGGSNNVSVLQGNGAGGFALPSNFNAANSPSAVTAGDFNADGNTDLVAANADSNNVSILLNSCGAPPPAPILLTDDTTGRAAALDSVTRVRDPFPVFTTLNFSADQHTRIVLFVVNVAPGETASVVTVQAEDSQNRIYWLPVESIGTMPNYEWLTEVVVRLPDDLTNLASVQLSIHVRGVASNKAPINIRQ
ncbi:MAG: FG-GAP repeat domain-containing protein [Pyrinomonadaceae bacterium]